MSRNFVLYIVFLCFAAAGLFAQSENGVKLEVSPNPVGRDDRFGVTIQVPIEDSSTVEVEEPDLSSDILLLRGPYIRPVYIDGPDGERIQHTEISYLYRCSGTGRYEIDPYRIIGADRVYQTDPQLLEVGVYRNRQLVIPLELEWSLSDTSAYVGQNIISVINALEQPEIRLFEDVRVGSPSEGFFEAAEGVGSINRIERGGRTLYEIPIAGYMFTPSTPGQVVLPQARVNYQDGQAVTDRPTIEVRPLPERVRESGAVGNFLLTARLEKQEVRRGEQVQLIVKVEGTGNLNYLQFPKLELDGFSQLQAEEASEYVPTQQGYQGSREYVYTLAAEETGRKRIRVSALNAVQPQTGRVYATRSPSFSVEVLSGNTDTETAEGEGELAFTPIELDSMRRAEISTRFMQLDSYVWLLPGPLLLLLFLLLKRRKTTLVLPVLLLLSFGAAEFDSDQVVQTIENAREAYRRESYKNAESLYLEALRLRPDVPDLRYNAALAAYQKGDIGAAVLRARTALTLQPMNETYKAFLDFVSQEYGITTEIDLPFPFHPDLFLLVLSLLVNAAGFLGIIYLFRQKNGYFIVAALLLLISVVVGIGFSYSIAQANRDIGVIVIQREAAPPIKKIPREDSSDAFTLKDGELVRIKGETGEFYFIETGLGQKGWVYKAGIDPVPGLPQL
ncbi:MAG: BatD family protein [bacterium]